MEMDISERHLAWFTAIPLPEVSDYPEGEYPYEASQAGEGARRPDGAYPLMLGGSYLLSASSLASGIGIVAESIAPYESNDGVEGREGDCSLPEELRFVQSFQLKNTNVLPIPAGTDADIHYVYRPEATAAIKQELLKDRGVAVAYRAGSGSPPPSREEQKANYEEILSFEDMPAGDKEALIGILLGDIKAETLPDEQLRRIVQFRCTLYGILAVGGMYIPELNMFNLGAASLNGNICDANSTETLYGSLGWHIAHELSHGYDLQGAQQDVTGTAPLFTEEDNKYFTDQSMKIAGQLSRIETGNGGATGSFLRPRRT